MRIEAISSGSSFFGKSKVVKKISNAKINEINKSTSLIIKNLYELEERNKQQNQQKKQQRFKSHNNIFLVSNIDKEMYVSYLYSNTNEVLVELERLIFDTAIGMSLKEYYFLLKNEDNIEVGFDKRNFSGDFKVSYMNIKYSKIFLQGNETLISMASTLIHELTHLKDINNIKNSAGLRHFTIFDLEINAFANEYIFFIQGDYLTNIEFDGLTDTAKLLLDGSSKYYNNKNINSKIYLLDLLSDVGYVNTELNTIYID